MIDLDKAEALLRGEGLEVLPSMGSTAAGYRPDGDSFLVHRSGRPVLAGVDGTVREAAGMEALAARLLRAAALCRRIEAECRVDEKGG